LLSILFSQLKKTAVHIKNISLNGISIIYITLNLILIISLGSEKVKNIHHGRRGLTFVKLSVGTLFT